MNLNYAQYKYCTEAKSKVHDWEIMSTLAYRGAVPYTMFFLRFGPIYEQYTVNSKRKESIAISNNFLLNGVTGVVITMNWVDVHVQLCVYNSLSVHSVNKVMCCCLAKCRSSTWNVRIDLNTSAGAPFFVSYYCGHNDKICLRNAGSCIIKIPFGSALYQTVTYVSRLS